MFDQTLRARLKNGDTLLGQFVQIPAPALVEIAGLTGFDFTLIDNEHGPAGFETTENLIRAAQCVGNPAVVRVSDNNPKEILRVLDLGACGIMVPQINTAAEAEKAVRACRYPMSGGTRGVATSTRAAGYTLFGGVPHFENSDRSIVTILQLETAQALANLDQILMVGGIDCLFIGPADLSSSLGHPANPGHPEVQAAIADAISRINYAGIVPGIMVGPGVDGFRQWQAAGARLICVGSTNVIVAAMQQQVKSVKEG